MNQSMPMQMIKCRSQIQSQTRAFGYGKPGPELEPSRKGVRDVSLRVHPLSGGSIVSEFHDIKKVALGIVASDVKNVNKPGMAPRNGSEFLNAPKLALVRSITVKRIPENNFNRVVRPDFVLGHPDLAIGAAADSAKHAVIRDRRRRVSPNW